MPGLSRASGHAALDDVNFGKIESPIVSTSAGESSTEFFESSSELSGPMSSIISATPRIKQNEQRTDVQPMSVNFTSPSELTLTGPGTSLKISGVDATSSMESVHDKDRGIHFHFGGTTTVTIINLK